MLPSTAKPSAPPTSRVVSFAAEPTPACSGISEPMIDSVAGAMVSAIPAASTSIETSNVPYPVSTPSRVISSRPVPTSANPAATTTLGADPLGCLRGQRRDDQQGGGEGQVAHPGLQGRVAHHRLHVLG